MSNSSTNNDIPRAHPELDRLLSPIVTDFTVGKYVDSDPERTPVYPSVHDLPRNELLLSEREVKAYRKSFQGRPIEHFNPYARLKPMVAEIFDSIMDKRYALDSDQSKAFTGLGMDERGAFTHPVELVVTVACKLLELLVNGTRSGFMQSNNEDQMKEAAGHEIPDFAARKLELCNALMLEKSIAHDVLSGDEQLWVNFVFAPGAYAVVKSRLRCSMERKARRRSRIAERDVYMPDTDDEVDISGFYQAHREPRYEASRYPFYNEMGPALTSCSMIKADAYLKEALPRLPPQPDRFLDTMKGAKPYLVIKMYEAIRDVTDIQNAPNSADYKRFVVPENGRQPAFTPRTSPKAMIEACWRILDFFLEGVENGFLLPYSKPNPAKEPVIVSHSDYHCVRRFASMLEILRREKTVCWKFLKSNHQLDEFVYWPYEWTDYRREAHSINEWLRARKEDRDQMLADAIEEEEENDAYHTIAAEDGLVSADAAAFMEELRAAFSATEDVNAPEDANEPQDYSTAEDGNTSEDDDFEAPAAPPSDEIDVEEQPERQLTAFSDGFATNGAHVSAVEADDWDMDEEEGQAADDAEIPIDPTLEATTDLLDEQMAWDAIGVEWVDRDTFFGAQEAEVDADVMDIDSLPPATQRSGAPTTAAKPAVAAQHDEDGAEELEDDEFLKSCTMMVENTDQDGQVTIN
ncbi:uncharacterized protein LTHEOB_4655 [Lasiodiplodia theobromae]|uniref:uncharacterized protein n=1 Tax=Lasiodiplodia theobromae TaxID=45133 RepID=UPI0015C37E5D|nr:uncharacterized protein LTHEOB_4655 [Lasiodiplodia theobromae]KAF4546003.1 hypothetical protein LTHEOB_4655 [Lasiodiplodia theobromae]